MQTARAHARAKEKKRRRYVLYTCNPPPLPLPSRTSMDPSAPTSETRHLSGFHDLQFPLYYRSPSSAEQAFILKSPSVPKDPGEILYSDYVPISGRESGVEERVLRCRVPFDCLKWIGIILCSLIGSCKCPVLLNWSWQGATTMCEKRPVAKLFIMNFHKIKSQRMICVWLC